MSMGSSIFKLEDRLRGLFLANNFFAHLRP